MVLMMSFSKCQQDGEHCGMFQKEILIKEIHKINTDNGNHINKDYGKKIIFKVPTSK